MKSRTDAPSLTRGTVPESPRRACFPLPWRSRWLRALWMALVLGLLLGEDVLWIWEMARLFPAQALDFLQHYMLGVWVRQGGSVTHPLWPERVGLDWPLWMYGIIPFLPYQPLMLPWMRLLAGLPPAPALLLWQAGMVLVWWGLAGPVARTLNVSPGCVRLLLFLFPPFWEAVYLGNVDGYLAALVAAALVLRYRGRWTASGFLWGWVSAFKPFLLLGALPLLWKRPRSGWLGLLLGFGHALGVAFLAVGGRGLAFFAQHFGVYVQRTSARFLAFSGSLMGWLFAWVGTPSPATRPVLDVNGPVGAMALGMSVVLLGVTFWTWMRHRRWMGDSGWAEGLWLAMAMLLGPFTWPQYRLYLFLPGLVLSRKLAAQGGRLASLWFWLLPLLLSGYFWTRVVVDLAAPYRVVALFLGSVYVTIWLFFTVVPWRKRAGGASDGATA